MEGALEAVVAEYMGRQSSVLKQGTSEGDKEKPFATCDA